MDHSCFDDSRRIERPGTFRAAIRERVSNWFGRSPESRHTPTPNPNPGSISGSHPGADTLEVPRRSLPDLIDAAGPWPRRAAASVEALGLDRVSHRYGAMTAVDQVSLSIAAGEILCLVGPSGCGKSTLLRLAAGLEHLQHGAIRISGRTVADETGCMPPEKRGVGLVFQDYALFPHLSVLDNVRFGLSSLPAEIQRRRALESLEQVGMARYADHFPHALSGGQQQRVALARALAPNPAVLLLDEPFSGLDTRLRHQVRDETLHVLKRNGAATMLVTHDPEEAMFLADRIALMRDGRLIQLGSPVELYTRPACAFAAMFFGEVNRLTGTVRQGAVETPVGRVPSDRPEGSAVQILVRPEALHLMPLSGGNGSGAHLPNLARVMAARLLGRTSLIHLSVPDGQGGTCHLHARVPGQFLPPEDSHVSIALNERQAFVFPADDPT
jgi:iron(III) transport system ATP-binding protein